MKRSAALFLSISFLGALTVCAEEGRIAGLTLLRYSGARPSAMGEAYVAAPPDIQSLAFNPAAVARMPHSALSASYNNGIADDNFGHVSYGHIFSFGSIFLGGSYYDAGDIDLNLTGGVQQTVKAQQDMVGMAGFAIGRNLPFSLGVNAKIFKSELAEAATAEGVAVDGGVYWQTPFKWLSFGGSLQNVGSDIKYEVAKEPLPQTLRGGAALNFNLEDLSKFTQIPYRVVLAVDGVKTKDRDASVNSGLELRRDMVVMDQSGYAALRAGYESGPGKMSAGVGILIGSFQLDYALGFSKDNLDNVHRVTIGWHFIPAKQKLNLETYTR